MHPRSDPYMACKVLSWRPCGLYYSHGQFVYSPRCVPDDWKIAVEKPLLKKSALELAYKDFRPVSNLPFIAKIVEKAACLQLLKRCEGFRRFQSAETVLLKV